MMTSPSVILGNTKRTTITRAATAKIGKIRSNMFLPLSKCSTMFIDEHDDHPPDSGCCTPYKMGGTRGIVHSYKSVRREIDYSGKMSLTGRLKLGSTSPPSSVALRSKGLLRRLPSSSSWKT